MSMMTLCVNVPASISPNTCIELTGNSAKLWIGEGLPVFEGAIESLIEAYPTIGQYLLEKNYIKRN